MTFVHAVPGLVCGSIASTVALLLFPHFFGRFGEIWVLPVVAAALGVLLGAVRRTTDRKPRPARRLVLALALLVPALAFAARSPARNWTVAPEMLVFCVDGGTWRIVDPLLEAGEMPTMAGLRRQGVSGILESTDPSFTPIVWTTIGTGVSPESHGITSFYATQEDLQAKRFWEVLEEHGRSVGLFRWLVTWPPRETKGFVIPDILARDDRSFPPEYAFVNGLRTQKKSGRRASAGWYAGSAWKLLRSGLRLETCVAAARELWAARRAGQHEDAHIAMRRIEIRLNADLYAHLLREKEPDFTCFYDNGTDVLGHRYWEYYEPDLFPEPDREASARYGRSIPEYYVLLDEEMGRLLDHVAPDTRVVVLSDHGQVGDPGFGSYFYARAERILGDLGLDGECYGVALGSRTYLESVSGDPEERKRTLERAFALLECVRVEGTGGPVFAPSWSDSSRILLRSSPDLPSLDGEVVVDGKGFALDDWFITKAMSGTHEPPGIYVFSGDPFRAMESGPELQLVDVAPTLLHVAGVPVSRELEGTVAESLLDDDFRRANPIARVDGYGRFEIERRDLVVDEEARDRLRALGYIR